MTDSKPSAQIPRAAELRDRIDNLMASNQEELERLAREHIGSGELPCLSSSRMWGSHGSGAPCSLCDQPVRPDEVEYEVVSTIVEGTLRFHLACHAAWQSECQRRAAAESINFRD